VAAAEPASSSTYRSTPRPAATSASGSILHPALTSVVMPVEDISRHVVSRAVEQIENGPDGDPGVVVPTWVRVGGSTPARDASHRRAR